MFRRKPSPMLTYISQKTEFEGIIHAEGMLRIDGIVHGTVEVQGDLEISDTGLIEGPEVRAKNIVVRGVLKARVSAEGKLTLSRTARLEGDVVAGSLEIESGAYYTGYIETRDAKSLPPSQSLPELYGTTESPPSPSQGPL
ncbi:cell shape determination protein CcmA [filamentous cyanobacterium CCP5]|nr:cell shape determination protein CcmA [filamentous cyanobacterium CCP5]